MVSGPSGSGKGTILNEVCSLKNDVGLCVSATTRKPRVGEQNGVEYYFLERSVFKKYIETGEMLEYNKYCGNYYGTLKQEIISLLNSHEIVIVEVDVNGAKKIANVFDCVKIFILPPSLNILKQRLLGRCTETQVDLQKRLTQACVEVKSALNYDYVVLNDDLKQAVFKFNSILEAQLQLSYRFKFLIDGFSG